MELKTKVHAEDDKHDLIITRAFDIPVALLYKAYTEAALLEQWMDTKVIHLENNPNGYFLFETTDSKGNKMTFRGTIHNCIKDQKIIRTFEFEGMPFGVQLETIEFISKSENTCELKIHSIFQSVEQRNQQLKLPFAFGMSMAHNKLEEILTNHE